MTLITDPGICVKSLGKETKEGEVLGEGCETNPIPPHDGTTTTGKSRIPPT